jgi:hypothetical protein
MKLIDLMGVCGLGWVRGGPRLEISVVLKILNIIKEKIIIRDISVKQQIIYEITSNITCILKKIKKTKNKKMSIQKRKPTTYI